MCVTERGTGPKYIGIYSCMYIVYRVLSILYRFSPGFREIAVFEKSKRFFILFFDGRYREGIRALARAQIYICVSIYVSRQFV